MHQQPDVQISLETGHTDDSVIVKKIYDSSLSKKNKAKIEDKLPEVTIHLFKQEDIENLKKLEEKIIEENYPDEPTHNKSFRISLIELIEKL